jgi:ectoine hydroxylase-related dioxygenase (phytanoyl-CoA dioxygenase family)
MGYENYFGFSQHQVTGELEYHMEEIYVNGYTILENVVEVETLRDIRVKLDIARKRQLEEFGEVKLKRIKDFGTIRCLPNENSFYVDEIALNEKVYKLISSILGETCILHLQNGIIVHPNQKKHNEGNWHRDFQKPFTSSEPLSLNALWVIDEFNKETGGTWIVPNSHNLKKMPSNEFIERNKKQIEAKEGSVIVFNSMLWHKGGDNYTHDFRRAINNQYTKPFIKQQIDLPTFLGDSYNKKSKAAQLLGYWSVPPKSVKSFRVENVNDRSYRAGQG